MIKVTLSLLLVTGVAAGNNKPRMRTNRKLAASSACINSIMTSLSGGSPASGFDLVGCDVSTIYDAVDEEVSNLADCNGATTEEALQVLLGASSTAANVITAAIDDMCAAAKAAFDATSTTDYFDMDTSKPASWYTDFYDGNTILNEHVDNDAGTTMLEDEAAFVQDFFDARVTQGPISFPSSIPSFDSCASEAAMCCWVQDRQDDGSGACAGETYAENCDDADPGKNTNVCYVDHTRGAKSSRVDGGFGIFNNNEKVHCHGIVWTGNAADDITRYRGNNLYFVSLKDHLYDRGYVRQVPGAPMCGCIDKMPVTTKSDCSQVNVEETFNFTFDGTSLSGTITSSSVEFAACNPPGGGNDNDLAQYWAYKHPDNAAEIESYLVGKDNCDDAVSTFLAGKGIVTA